MILPALPNRNLPGYSPFLLPSLFFPPVADAVEYREPDGPKDNDCPDDAADYPEYRAYLHPATSPVCSFPER